MPALSSQQLASATNCLRCLTGYPSQQVFAYLVSVWAGGSTDPQALGNASNLFQAFTGSEADAALTYMLAVVAGGSQDPNVLSIDARCFSCADGVHPFAQIYSLASITSNSTDPNALLAASNAWQGILNFSAVTLYLLSQKSGVAASALADGAKCFTCIPAGDQDRIQTMLLADIAGGVLP